MLPFYIAGTMLCAGLYTMMANVDSRVWLLRRFVEHAADRTVMVGAGGLIQILFLAVLFRRYHFNLREVPPPPQLTGIYAGNHPRIPAPNPSAMVDHLCCAHHGTGAKDG